MQYFIYGGYSNTADSAILATTSTNLAGGVLGTTFAQTSANITAAVPPNTTTTKKVYKMTGNGTVGAAPTWEQASVAEASDYITGTFTCSLINSTPGNLSISYSSQTGTYTKVGNLVTVNFIIVTSSFTHTTASGTWRLSGLPFAIASGTVPVASIQFQGIAATALYTQYYIQGSAGSTQVTLLKSGAGQNIATVFGGSEMPSGGTVNIVFSLTYQI